MPTEEVNEKNLSTEEVNCGYAKIFHHFDIGLFDESNRQ